MLLYSAHLANLLAWSSLKLPLTQLAAAVAAWEVLAGAPSFAAWICEIHRGPQWAVGVLCGRFASGQLVEELQRLYLYAGSSLTSSLAWQCAWR